MVAHPVGPWGGNLVLAMTVTVMSGGASVFAQDVFSENFDSRAEAIAVGKLPGWEHVWGSDVPIRSGLPIDPTGSTLLMNAAFNARTDMLEFLLTENVSNVVSRQIIAAIWVALCLF